MEEVNKQKVNERETQQPTKQWGGGGISNAFQTYVQSRTKFECSFGAFLLRDKERLGTVTGSFSPQCVILKHIFFHWQNHFETILCEEKHNQRIARGMFCERDTSCFDSFISSVRACSLIFRP